MEKLTTNWIVARLLRFLILALVAGTAVVLYTTYVDPSLRYHALVLSGRGFGCLADQPAETMRTLRRQANRANALRREIKRLDKDAAGFELWETPSGRFWAPRRTSHNLPVLLAEQEARIYGSGEHQVRPGEVVLDCGAHVGVFTRLALAAGARLVVAVEVSPDNVAALQRTFAPEIETGRVIVYPKGVWDHDDILTLWTPRGTSLDDSLVIHGDDDTQGVRVPLTTIDKLAAELRLERVDFIKLNVEGAEERAVAGARETLRRYKPHLSVATENTAEQAERIPAVIAGIRRDYHLAAGRCFDQFTWLWPHVLYFR